MAAAGKRRHGFGVGGTALALLAAYVIVLMISQQVQIAALDSQRQGIEDRVLGLRSELAVLDEQRELLLSDAYVEELARRHLGMVKPGEILYTVAEQK